MSAESNSALPAVHRAHRKRRQRDARRLELARERRAVRSEPRCAQIRRPDAQHGELVAVQHEFGIDHAERRQRQRDARSPGVSGGGAAVFALFTRIFTRIVGLSFDFPVEARARPCFALPAELAVGEHVELLAHGVERRRMDARRQRCLHRRVVLHPIAGCQRSPGKRRPPPSFCVSVKSSGTDNVRGSTRDRGSFASDTVLRWPASHCAR